MGFERGPFRVVDNYGRLKLGEFPQLRPKFADSRGIRGTQRNSQLAGGGGGIRTHETLSGLTVFKTAGVNHFPTPPLKTAFLMLAYMALRDNRQRNCSYRCKLSPNCH
jgi:hypothetical protein